LASGYWFLVFGYLYEAIGFWLLAFITSKKPIAKS